MNELLNLWRGELPLGRAFWGWAILGGLAVNLVTSVLFLMLMSADRPLAAFMAGYGVSVPYNIVVLVGVWRAAGRHDGDLRYAEFARIVTLIGMAILTIM